MAKCEYEICPHCGKMIRPEDHWPFKVEDLNFNFSLKAVGIGFDPLLEPDVDYLPAKYWPASYRRGVNG